jgi:hypothetical protein
MNIGRRHRAAVVALLLAAFCPAWATPADAAPSPAPSERPQPGPTRYLYSATFEAEVNHGLRNVYGDDRNFGVENLSATVTGTLPDLEVTTKDVWRWIPRGKKAAVQVKRAAAKTTTATDDGGHVQNCTGSTAMPGGQPFYTSPGRVVPFAGLGFPVSCTTTEGDSGPATYSLPAIGATILKSSALSPGEVAKTFQLRGDSKTWPGPDRDETSCPGYAGEQTVSCAYTVRGTLTLKLIKKLAPPKPKGASITPGATKATTTLTCPVDCTVTIRLMPLDGGPTLEVIRISVPVGKPKKVTVPIPPKKRGAVKKSGGVQLEVTYQIAGMKVVETRGAEL